MGEDLYRKTGIIKRDNYCETESARIRADGTRLIIYSIRSPDPGFEEAAEKVMNNPVPGTDELLDIYHDSEGSLCVVSVPGDGRSLEKLLDGNKIDPAEASGIIRGIAAEVNKIHEAGLSYGGLHLDSIRLSGREGISLASPVHAFSEKNADADIRSIGAVFFRILTNREELGGGHTSLAELPENARRFVQRCTSGHYGSDSGALLEDIGELLGGESEKKDKSAVTDRFLRNMIIGIACLILAVFVYMLAAAGGRLSVPERGSSGSAAEESGRITVPDLAGLALSDATAELTAQGIGIRNAGEVTNNAEAGTIVDQSPSAGTEVSINSTVIVYVSAGPASYRIPDLVGKLCTAAESTLRGEGYDNIEIIKETSDAVKCGYIISTSPAAGQKTATSEKIRLHVSLGRSADVEVEIGDYVGETENKALKDCAENGIFPTVRTGYSDITQSGHVMAQSIAPRMVTKTGGDIVLTVASDETPPLKTDENWEAAVVLDAPANYGGGAYRLVLEESVDGDFYELTAEEGDAVSFPHNINVSGIRGTDTGVLHLYEQTDDGYVSRCTWNLTFAEKND